MALIPIDSALSFLAGPIVRARSAERIHLLVPLQRPCDDVRLTLRWKRAGGRSSVVGSSTAKPVERNGVRLAFLKLGLGRAADAEPAALDWQLSLSVPDAPGSQPWFGDLAMGIPLPVFMDVQPALSEVFTGQLLCAFGPLQLGRLEFRIDSTGLADAAVRAVRDILIEAAAADADLRRRMASALRLRPDSVAQHIARMQPEALRDLWSALLMVPFGALPSTRQRELMSRMASAAVGPEVSLAGNLQPRLLGMRLSAAPIPVRGTLSPTSASFQCHISLRELLSPLLAGTMLSEGPSALLFASAPLPKLANAADPLAARPTDAEIPAAEQTRRWQRLASEGRWLVSFAGTFLGLDLAQAGGRFAVPSVRPEGTAAGGGGAGDAESTRVLGALTASRPGKAPLLLDAGWDGQLANIAGVPTALRAKALHDMFPLGGFIAGAEWQLPDLLTRSPAEAWASLAGTASALLDPATWQSAASLRSAVGGLLAPRAFARLGFYYPAPTPPAAGGSAPDLDAALAAWVARCQMDVVTEELPLSADWPADESLLDIAVLPGAQILGLPVRALERLSPPRSQDLQLRLGLPAGNWLDTLLGGRLPDALVLRLTPPARAWNVHTATELLATLLETGASGLSDAAVLQTIAQRGASELAERLYAPLGLPAPPAAHDDLAASPALAGLGSRMARGKQLMQSASSGAGAATAAGFMTEMMFEALPRLQIRQELDLTRLPGLPGVTLRGQVGLEAASPAPAARGRRGMDAGGFFLEATDVGVKIGPASASLPRLRLEITPPFGGATAGLRGEVKLQGFRVPGVNVRRARLLIDTASAWKAAIEADIAPIHWSVPGPLNGGSLRIEPLAGQALSLRFEAVSARTVLSPASLHIALGLIEASGALRGPAPGEPLEISLSAGWDGRVDLTHLRLNNPFVPGTAAATWSGLVGVRVTGNGLTSLGIASDNLPTRALNLLQAALPLNMTDPGTLAFDSGGDFVLQAPVQAGIAGLVELEGALKFSPVGGDPKAAVQGSLRLPPLAGFELHGDVQLGPQGLQIQGSSGPFPLGLPSLLELAASAWSVAVDLPGAAVTLLPTTGIHTTLLGASLASNATVSAQFSTAEGLRLAYKSSSWWTPPGLSGLFALRPDLELTGGSLRLRGSYRLLKRSGQSEWKHQGEADWSWNALSPELPVLAGNALKALFPSNGLLKIKNNGGLVLGRDDDGWWLELRGFSIQVLWKEITAPTARVSQNGQIQLELANQSFAANGLTWTPTAAVKARANLRAVSILPEYRIPKGPVAAAFEGWPTISLPNSGWQSSVTPTASAEKSASGTWREVPLLGGVSRTEYRFDKPNVSVRLRATTPRLRGEVTTGGLRFRQWIPNNPLTPTNDAHWKYLTASPASQTFSLTADGALSANISFGLTGSGQEKPDLKHVLT